MTSRIKLLVANTRTGSTALGAGLSESNESFFASGEVFNPSAKQQSEAFFSWVRDNQISAYEFMNNKLGVTKNYLNWVDNLHEASHLLLDAKYHDLLMFMPCPSLFDFPPVLFLAAKDLEIPIIHLKRRDKFESSLSELVAAHTNVHHVKAGQALPAIDPTNISWDQLRDQIRLRIVEEALVTRQLEHAQANVATIYYEDVFLAQDRSFLNDIRNKFSLKWHFEGTPYRKIGILYDKIVTNYAELQQRYSNESWDTLW